jgi:hypothetical protein
VPNARPDRNKRPGVCHDPRWTQCVPFKADPATVELEIRDHRSSYLKAEWVCNEGEAEWHRVLVDLLIRWQTATMCGEKDAAAMIALQIKVVEGPDVQP